jgi:peptidoglycan/xylan/chitin deacetylase (PgdA/CDA1 family)
MLVRQTALVFAAGIFATVGIAFTSSAYLAYSDSGPIAILDQPLIEEFDDLYGLEPIEAEPEITVPSRTLPSSPYLLHQPPLAYLRNVVGNPLIKKDEMAVDVPVLMYHHIRPILASYNAKERKYTVTPEAFEAQMIELVNAGYTTISPDELERALREGPAFLPKKPVLLTFDDGYQEHYHRAYPILKKYGLKATYFIVTDDRPKRRYVTDAMLKEMDESGLITIASHTKNHAFLTKLGSAARTDEIKGSKEDLEAILGHSVDYFAYPYGAISPQIEQEVEDAGYKLGFWIRLGYLHAPSSKYQLRRIRVEEGESMVALLEAFNEK